jgi:hypothetical protein
MTTSRGAMNYRNIQELPDHVLFTECSLIVLSISIIILLVWRSDAKKNSVSIAMQNTFGDSNYFLFLTTHAKTFLAKIMLVAAIISIFCSIYYYFECGKIINVAIQPGIDTWRIYETYTKYMAYCEYAINIGIFILPLTIIPLWWDWHVNRIFLHRGYNRPAFSPDGNNKIYDLTNKIEPVFPKDGIYPCKICGQKLRVPPNKEVLATCPKCKSTYQYP